MADPLDLNLRLGHMQRAQRRAQPRLSQNLRQLGAVGPYVPAPGAGSQQAVVHGWLGKPGTTGGHLYYLQHGKGDGKTQAPLFGLAPQDFAARALTDPHQFRWSVSLKDPQRHFDFQGYVTLFMQQVQRDLGRRIDWVAAVHHDTPHPHAHVVVRGRDMDGQALYLTKDYLGRGLGYRASALATALLGRTQESERTREQSREPDRTPQHTMGPAMEPGDRTLDTSEYPEEWHQEDWDGLAEYERELEEEHRQSPEDWGYDDWNGLVEHERHLERRSRDRDRGMGW